MEQHSHHDGKYRLPETYTMKKGGGRLQISQLFIFIQNYHSNLALFINIFLTIPTHLWAL